LVAFVKLSSKEKTKYAVFEHDITIAKITTVSRTDLVDTNVDSLQRITFTNAFFSRSLVILIFYMLNH